MTQHSGPFFDGMARLMTDAMGVAEGVRKEVDSATRAQAERFLNMMDVVRRDEVETIKAIAIAAREENELLRQRIAQLEARVGLTTPPEQG